MSNTIVPVILAGGQGTRLWPASLPHIPKQFIKIGQHSLMYHAIERAQAVATEEVLVVTAEGYLGLFEELLQGELDKNGIDSTHITLIGEAVPKNTAPAIAYAVRYLKEKYINAVVLVITADHLITPTEIFAQDVQNAVALSMGGESQPERIVTFGITPSHTETGYGYIEAGEKLSDIGFKVQSFKEKPDKESAEKYISLGNYYWNSGMFCFSVAVMERELKQYCAEIDNTIISSATLTWNTSQRGKFSAYIPEGIDYQQLSKISIDYAVMEHTAYVGLIQAHFDWNDIGSWDEAAALLEDSQRHYVVNADNVTVYSDVPVGVSGVSDLIVVAKNEKILILRKGDGQYVSAIAKQDKME